MAGSRARAADGGRAHGRRRRRVDRMARRRRRAAGGPALGGGRPRTGLLRARWQRADGHRREPRARVPRRRTLRWQAGRARSRAADRALAGLAEELGLEPVEAAAGVARVASAEMARAVRVGDGGARHRPARAGARGLRWGGAAARRRNRRGAGHAQGARAAGRRGALGARPRCCRAPARRAPQRAVERRGAHARPWPRSCASSAEEGRRDLGEPEAELRASYELRYAGPGVRAAGGGGARPRPTDVRERFERAHEARYGYADPGAELELVTVAGAATPGGGAAGARARGPARRARAGPCSRAIGSIPPCRGEGARGPAVFDAARLDARGAARMARAVRAGRGGDGAMSALDPVTLR